MALLEVRDLRVSFGEIEAVRGVSFTIKEGAVVTLLGSNGAGKSTTAARDLRACRAACWLDPVRRQDDRAAEPSRDRQSRCRACARGAARLSRPHCAREHHAWRLERERLRCSDPARDRCDVRCLSRHQAIRGLPWLDAFGRPAADGRGRPRSDGQASPIVARRAFARPRAGHRAGGVSDHAEIHMRGTTVLLVEQNAHMALKVANWGYVLESGRLALGGDPATLWRDERIRDAYLGGGQAKAST